MARYSKSTAKLETILAFIKLFILKNGYPPTVREIIAAPECQIKSTSSAKAYIDRLVEEGKIIKTDNKNRALEVVGFAANPTTQTETPVNVSKIPVLGNIAAGAPLMAAVENDRSYSIPNDYFTVKNQNFLLQVKGTSMINAGILDGDMVLIRAQNTAENGQIVVAQIDNEEVTLKRYYNCVSYVKLKPENDEMDDIIVNPGQTFRVLGVAIGLMRNHIF